MLIFLYEIECEINGCIYVGISENVEYRFSQHKEGTGSKFTKIYGAKSYKIISKYNNIYFAREAERNHVLKLRKEFPTKNISGAGVKPVTWDRFFNQRPTLIAQN